VAHRYNVQPVSCRRVSGIRGTKCGRSRLFGWEQSNRKYFSFSELSPFLQKIEEQGEESEKLESAQRSAYQNAILNLRNGLVLYVRLKNSVQPEDALNFAGELQVFENSLPVAGKATRQRQGGENFDKAKRRRRAHDSALRKVIEDGVYSGDATGRPSE
jgi:hypothetical protein